MAQRPDSSTSSKLTYAVMVKDAIGQLNERKGSSAIAITKFMAQKYSVEGGHAIRHIKKYLKKGLEQGELTQTSGSGLGGSFKVCLLFFFYFT